MRGLAYVSTAIVPFDREALQGLAVHAAQRNLELGITGYLYFESGRFFQYIEGERRTVDELMDVIDRDDRHDVLGTIVDDALVDRRFPDWSMGLVDRCGVPRVEEVLTRHLHLVLSASDPDPAWERIAWQLIDEITRLQMYVPRLFS